MQNPAHTLIIHVDADGNLEFKDLRTGVEGQVPAGDEVRFKTSSGRTLLIDNGAADSTDTADHDLEEQQ